MIATTRIYLVGSSQSGYGSLTFGLARKIQECSHVRSGAFAEAKTRAGGCCQVRAEPGKARCRFHGGKSTGPNTQAGRARIAQAQRERWRASIGREFGLTAQLWRKR
jgi:hypothetical protein